MASYSIARLMGHLQGAGANTVATLQAHCYAAMPGITAKQCSQARALYRSMGNGANANGASRYPAQAGRVYAAQLGASVAAGKPGATAKQVATLRKRNGQVWAKQRAAANAASVATKRAAKVAAAGGTPPTPAVAPSAPVQVPAS